MKQHSAFRYAKHILLLIAALGLAGGCSRSGDTQDDYGRIRLGVRSTRAVNSLDDLSKVGDNIGIFGVPTEETSVPAAGTQWGGTPVMDNVRTSGVDASTGAISWEGVYYYPLETDRYVEFCAYYPYAALGTGGDFSVQAPASGQAPVLRFTLSGQEDVMYAGPVVGGRNLAPGGMEFRHVLTQMRFQVIDQNGTLSGETLDGIVFTGANAKGTMNIETGALGAWSGPAELSVPAIDAEPIVGTSAQPQKVGGEIMLQPGQASFDIRVVTSGVTYNNIAVRPTSLVGGVPETSFAAGRSYLITLTIQQKDEIVLSATVVPWQMGGTGSAIVQ